MRARRTVAGRITVALLVAATAFLLAGCSDDEVTVSSECAEWLEWLDGAPGDWDRHGFWWRDFSAWTGCGVHAEIGCKRIEKFLSELSDTTEPPEGGVTDLTWMLPPRDPPEAYLFAAIERSAAWNHYNEVCWIPFRDGLRNADDDAFVDAVDERQEQQWSEGESFEFTDEEGERYLSVLERDRERIAKIIDHPAHTWHFAARFLVYEVAEEACSGLLEGQMDYLGEARDGMENAILRQSPSRVLDAIREAEVSIHAIDVTLTMCSHHFDTEFADGLVDLLNTLGEELHYARRDLQMQTP